MDRKQLRAFWISLPPHTLGDSYGVTGFSLRDGLDLLAKRGFDLTGDQADWFVIEDVTWEDLDQNHVLPNSGPLFIRGIWFPLEKIGA